MDGELSTYHTEVLNQLKELNSYMKIMIESLTRIENELYDLEKVQLINQ